MIKIRIIKNKSEGLNNKIFHKSVPLVDSSLKFWTYHQLIQAPIFKLKVTPFIRSKKSTKLKSRNLCEPFTREY